MSKLRELVRATVDGHQNSAKDVQGAFAEMLSGEASPTLMASFLTALRTRGESVDEIVGAVRAMRAAMARVSAPAGSVDVVGTGGDGAHTYNISTAVSFVVAGAGVPVAKHGNRAASWLSQTVELSGLISRNKGFRPADTGSREIDLATGHGPCVAQMEPRRLGRRYVAAGCSLRSCEPPRFTRGERRNCSMDNGPVGSLAALD